MNEAVSCHIFFLLVVVVVLFCFKELLFLPKTTATYMGKMKKAVLLVTVFFTFRHLRPKKRAQKGICFMTEKITLRALFSYLLKYSIVNLGNQEIVKDQIIVSK